MTSYLDELERRRNAWHRRLGRWLTTHGSLFLPCGLAGAGAGWWLGHPGAGLTVFGTAWCMTNWLCVMHNALVGRRR